MRVTYVGTLDINGAELEAQSMEIYMRSWNHLTTFQQKSLLQSYLSKDSPLLERENITFVEYDETEYIED